MSTKDRMCTTAFAPASIGNLSLGFDVLGAALKPIDGSLIGDSVSVSRAEETQLTVAGRFADRLPGETSDNIVMQCYHFFVEKLAALGQVPLPLQLHLEKRLPIGSGLGSSAASIVAALHALNVHHDSPFNADQLLLMMGELEGRISGSVHYDNVAPCYVGGITLMTGDEQSPAVKLPTIDDWYWVVSYSGLSVSTAAAREILPSQYDIQDTITFGRQIGVFVDALYRQDPIAAAKVIHDVIAEPWRKALLPGFDQARAYAMSNGALAFGISGSGPTVFGIASNLDDAQKIKTYLDQHYVQNSDGFSHVCTIPNCGATAEQHSE